MTREHMDGMIVIFMTSDDKKTLHILSGYFQKYLSAITLITIQSDYIDSKHSKTNNVIYLFLHTSNSHYKIIFLSSTNICLLHVYHNIQSDRNSKKNTTRKQMLFFINPIEPF